MIKSIQSQRGETIVEVLICMAALGFMLMSAFVLTNRNQAVAQASQERAQATKVMETQLELLRGYTTDAILPAGTFCLQENVAMNRVDAPPGACPIINMRYTVSVQNLNTNPGGLPCGINLPLIVRVTWDSRVKNTPQELTTYYAVCNKVIGVLAPGPPIVPPIVPPVVPPVVPPIVPPVVPPVVPPIVPPPRFPPPILCVYFPWFPGCP